MGEQESTYPVQPETTEDGYADPWLTDEEWDLLVRCEDIRTHIAKILDVRMRVAYDLGWLQGVGDTTRQWGPQGDSEGARARRLLWNVMTEHYDIPLYGRGADSRPTGEAP